MKILVTGASGFVGKAVFLSLNGIDGLTVVGSVRREPVIADACAPLFKVGELSAQTDWLVPLNGVQAVVHTAGRVHVMADKEANPLDEFRRVNVQGTINLAKQAAAASVRRFIFLSSIKVNGEKTQIGAPFTAEAAPAHLDAYSLSKWEAEQGLLEIASQTGIEVVIIRPPLIYGPGVKANFGAMMQCLKLGLPLPLGAINNQRSLVSIDNLIDLIITCLTHPAAVNQTFLVSDGEDVSTSELLRRMGKALGSPARLIPVPVSLLKLGAAMVGKQDVAQRLCESLQVDIEKTRSLLGWMPPILLDEGLKRAASYTA
jgi:nucleoside-diphosphate-sugar epimerase